MSAMYLPVVKHFDPSPSVRWRYAQPPLKAAARGAIVAGKLEQIYIKDVTFQIINYIRLIIIGQKIFVA